MIEGAKGIAVFSQYIRARIKQSEDSGDEARKTEWMGIYFDLQRICKRIALVDMEDQ